MSPRWALAGVVEAPADQVFANLCAIGPAGSGPLTRPPSPDATTDGVRRYIAPIGHPPVTTVTVEVDPTRRTLAVQGHWWYRGVHTVTAHSRGSLLDYRVHNVASWGRWMVPLMQWRLPWRMRRDLDQLLRMLGEQLGCAAYHLDRSHGSDAMTQRRTLATGRSDQETRRADAGWPGSTGCPRSAAQ